MAMGGPVCVMACFRWLGLGLLEEGVGALAHQGADQLAVQAHEYRR